MIVNEGLFIGIVIVALVITIILLVTGESGFMNCIVIISFALFMYSLGNVMSCKFPDAIKCTTCNSNAFIAEGRDKVFRVEDAEGNNYLYRLYYCEKCDKFIRVKGVNP